jgi:Secretion system C-terminal sorting domain
MKKLILLLLLICNIHFVFAQNLVVGFSNQNEILSLNTGTYNYDTVYVMNNGQLNLSNQVEFIVNDVIAIIGTAQLNVENSQFTAHNVFYMQDSAIARLSDTLNLPCSFYIIDNARVEIDSSVVQIPMTYKGQYIWSSNNTSGISLNHSQCFLGFGSLGGQFVDSSFFHQRNTDYYSSILPMTMDISGNSSLIVDSCSGGMEFVISESADVYINASDFFVIWYGFASGDTANYAYPPANSLVPNASDIVGNYQFSNAVPGVSGIDFTVDITDANYVFWGVISKEYSDVVVNNSTLIACGFFFQGSTVNNAIGMIDAQHYSTFQASFLDRNFEANNSTIMAWNFYPVDTSEIYIDSCIYGESLGFVNSITKITNSTCDGTGGYFGATGDSKTYVYDSQIIRGVGTTQQIINFQDNAQAWMYKTIISGSIVINDNTEMYFANCQYDSIPVVNNNAYFAEAWLDSLDNVYVDSSISIKGKVHDINGVLNNAKITRYVIQYSLPDTTNIVTIKDTSAVSFQLLNQELANWNTQGIAVGNYLLWLQIYVDGSDAISCKREITLNYNTAIQDKPILNSIEVYPNPTNGIVIVEGKGITQVRIYSLTGELMYCGNEERINMKGYNSGIYILKIETKDAVVVRKLVLKK